MTVIKIKGGKMSADVDTVLAPLADELYRNSGARLVGIVELKHVDRNEPAPDEDIKPTVTLRITHLEVAHGEQEHVLREGQKALYVLRTADGSLVVIDVADRRPVDFGKLANPELLNLIENWLGWHEAAVIEMVASYGMAVGAEVFETCVWIGRFYQALLGCRGQHPELVKRLAVKTHHCHDSKAKDTNIRQALVDRFAAGARNNGKGTKDAPGWFHGFHSDVWQAYALAVYAADTRIPLLVTPLKERSK